MADLKLDTSGDLAIENDSVVLVDGVNAVAQDIDIRLQFFLGEWFLDRRLGVPYYEKILGQKPRLAALKSIFRTAILTTPGVTAINDLTVDYDGTSRVLNVSFLATSTAGAIQYNKELIV